MSCVCGSKINSNASQVSFKKISVFKAKTKFSIPTEKDMHVLDDTGTEVDEEVFSDTLEEKTDILWTIVDTLSDSGKWSFHQIVLCKVIVLSCNH